MPYDEHGNLYTVQSASEIKTLHDVIVKDKKDVVALRVGGMATVAKDEGEGVEFAKATAEAGAGTEGG